MNEINIGLVGIGSVSGSLIEGLAYYKENKTEAGLIVPKIKNTELGDIYIATKSELMRERISA